MVFWSFFHIFTFLSNFVGFLCIFCAKTLAKHRYSVSEVFRMWYVCLFSVFSKFFDELCWFPLRGGGFWRGIDTDWSTHVSSQYGLCQCDGPGLRAWTLRVGIDCGPVQWVISSVMKTSSWQAHAARRLRGAFDETLPQPCPVRYPGGDGLCDGDLFLMI